MHNGVSCVDNASRSTMPLMMMMMVIINAMRMVMMDTLLVNAMVMKVIK
jgi:hypothetical protein